MGAILEVLGITFVLVLVLMVYVLACAAVLLMVERIAEAWEGVRFRRLKKEP